MLDSLELIPKILLLNSMGAQSSRMLDLLGPIPKILLLHPARSSEQWDIGLFGADSKNSAPTSHKELRSLGCCI